MNFRVCFKQLSVIIIPRLFYCQDFLTMHLFLTNLNGYFQLNQINKLYYLAQKKMIDISLKTTDLFNVE